MTDNKTIIERGIYINNFVAATFAIMFALLSIATGFFASYFFRLDKSATGLPTPNVTKQTVSAEDVYKKVRKLEKSDHVQGNRDAKIVLVEYTDFQCPYCGTFHTVAKEFTKKYPEYALVLRDLPLSFHPDAFNRAEYTECVAKEYGEDAYWAFVDKIFVQEDINSIDIAKLVTEAGYDVDKIKSCVASGEFKDEIAKEQEEGIALLTALDEEGRYGTPGNILINTETKKGVKLRGAVPLSEIEAQIKTLE